MSSPATFAIIENPGRILDSILIIVFILSQSGISQERDLFDQENSQKFASYLYESGQFELASEEFERVVFMNPNDSLSILRLLKAYRNQKKYGIGVRRAFELLPESSGLDNELFDEIFRISLLAGDFEKGKAYHFRIGAVIDAAEAEYNYAPAVRLMIPLDEDQ